MLSGNFVFLRLLFCDTLWAQSFPLTAPTNKFVGFQVGDLWGHHGAIASRRSGEHG